MTVFLEDEADNTEILYSRTIIFIQLLIPFCSLASRHSSKQVFKRCQFLRRIGLFGGSFDPVHQAHRELAVRTGEDRNRRAALARQHDLRGLVAIVLAAYDGKRASEAAKLDATELFAKIGLVEHLSAQRANGLRSMIRRIREESARFL